jgi:hypothetical protein
MAVSSYELHRQRVPVPQKIAIAAEGGCAT